MNDYTYKNRPKVNVPFLALTRYGDVFVAMRSRGDYIEMANRVSPNGEVNYGYSSVDEEEIFQWEYVSNLIPMKKAKAREVISELGIYSMSDDPCEELESRNFAWDGSRWVYS